MKKILIVEGISTSGKSSLIKELIGRLGGDRVHVFTESETHIPIREATDSLHIDFFKSLLQEALASETELIIFDRLYLTAAFRAKASINQYAEIENLLLQHDVLTAYLRVDEEVISNRIKSSLENPRVELGSEHSGVSWADHIKTRGQSFEEVAEYYIGQQRNQIESLKQSKLKSQIFDTTSHEYKTIADQILGQWFNK